MEELTALVTRAQRGDRNAYDALVRRFQDMAVGYAYSILGDFHLAQDAAQEAFVRAYLDLPQLEEPAAFAGWFRRIVFMRCGRFIRKKRPTVPLEDVELISEVPLPDESVQAGELEDEVRRTIRFLPVKERAITALFYIGGYSQREIGGFMGLPEKTVKSRLHSARKRLRERMIHMVAEHLHEQRPSKDKAFAGKVKEELDDIARLTDREVQLALREIDTLDLVVALQGAGDDLKKKIFANVSSRVRSFIEEGMEFGDKPGPEQIERTSAKIVNTIKHLHETGWISWPPTGREPDKLTKKYGKDRQRLISGLKDKLQETPLAGFGLEDVQTILVDLSKIADGEGVFALDKLAGHIRDDLLRLGVRLLADGYEPQLALNLLASRSETLLRHAETRSRIIVEGVLSIRRGDPPQVTNQRLQVFHPAMPEEMPPHKKASLADVESAAANPSPALPDLTELITAVAGAAHTEKFRTIADLINEKGREPLLAHGLTMAANQADPHAIRSALEIRAQGMAHRLETCHKMVLETVRAIQAGHKPADLRNNLSFFYEP